MGLYIVGLGLDKKSISADAMEVVKNCDMVYLEGYTVDFPYSMEELKESLGVKFSVLSREEVESEKIVERAKEEKIALLVYGDVLSATTHMQLVEACKEKDVKCRVYHNASIFNVVATTGLSLYKFGRATSIPNWKEHTNKPTSFIDYLKENKGTGAHTLILIDIGMSLEDAIGQLEEASEKEDFSELNEAIVLTKAGTAEQKMFYGKLDELKKVGVSKPYCIIVPGSLSEFEEKMLEKIKNN